MAQPGPTAAASSAGGAGVDADIADHLKTMTDRCPATLRWRIVEHHLLKVPKPYLPRALVAPDNEHPYGTLGRDHRNYTVLQQHVEFFDRNNDGIIYPWETFAGFRAIGFGSIISFLAMLFINGTMSYPTQESWIPSPFFSIYIKNMHRAIHGSDTGVYDNEGRFVPWRFEEIFMKFARTYPDKLTFWEMLEMTEAIRDALDFFGWIASKLEWGVTYWVIKDVKGLVPKEAIRGIYDGSIFYYLEKKSSATSMSKFY